MTIEKPPARPADPAVSICFAVEIDKEDLGYFSSCEGLGMEVVMEQREEGGNNGFVWQLPTRIKYSNIKLSRPVGKDSAKITGWLASLAEQLTWHTATIKAMASDSGGTTGSEKIIASWSLDGVVPVRWSGPSLNLESPKVAMETLEFAHHGFLPATAGTKQ